MKKIKRRTKKEEVPKRKIKRRKAKVERITANGKCSKCESLYLYCIENGDPTFLEKNPKKAERFNKLMAKGLCLACLTGEKTSIKAWEILNLHIHKGTELKCKNPK